MTPSKARQPASRVEQIFARLTAIYGHRFTSAFGEDPTSLAGDTWAKGLTGLSAGQLASGLDACITRNDAWPPTLPEFRGMCLGVPSLAEVKADMLDRDARRKPFTALVWRYIDPYRFRQSSQHQADHMLADAYELAREQAMRGVPLPTVLEEVANDPIPINPVPHETAVRHLKAIRELLPPVDEPEVGDAELNVPPLSEVEKELQVHYAALSDASRTRACDDPEPQP